jgi:hypothetical protein
LRGFPTTVSPFDVISGSQVADGGTASCMEGRFEYLGDDKSLAPPASLSVVFSVQGTGCSPTGPDPENRVDDQDIGSPGRPVSSGLQVHGEPFTSWSG